jgi:hypothetical protein
MSKVITDEELCEIVTRIFHSRGEVINERGAYLAFIENIARAVSFSCGGKIVCVSDRTEGEDLGPAAHIEWTDSVPPNGGIYAEYDTDVDIEEWRLDALWVPTDETERLSHSSMDASKAIDAFLRKDQELSDAFRCFNAAINFALDHADSEGLLFLGLWREGNWEAIAREFPEFDIQNTGTNDV